MSHFIIYFTRPWLLLLLIPAIGLTLLGHFLIAKKYRRTRNRIISMVLHMIVCFLCIFVLSGITYSYQVSNLQNEVILLVDVSDTQTESKERRDEFVRSVLEEGGYDDFKIGVVTFGFTQTYAVPLTYEVESVYEGYLAAPLPDTSATDIAEALRFTRALFQNPESGKIVLITDGKETDERASSVIHAIAAQGIRVDTVCISSAYEEETVQILGIELPEYHVNLKERCTIGVTVQSKTELGNVAIELYDNGVLDEEFGTVYADLAPGSQDVSFTKIFASEGLHELFVKIVAEDELHENNEYYTYLYLEVYNHVLIVEQAEGESEELADLLTQNDYSYDILNLKTSDEIPTSVADLLLYDQIILNNIANKDLPEGFDALLYSYVYEYGGGLFTAGGSDENGNAHAYNRSDMRDTLYQQLLPVEVINYTPPVGVMVVIDISGSMSALGANGLSNVDWAKQGAIACLDALTERDYIGVMTLASDYGVVLPLTQRTQDTLIREAILSIDGSGMTVFSTAIERAARALIAETRVDKRHIIIVTDGMPTESEANDYLSLTEQYYKNNGITLSVVGIGVGETGNVATAMKKLTDAGHGRFHPIANQRDLVPEMREDLNAPEIKELVNEPFNPQVGNVLSPLLNGVEYRNVVDEEGNVTARALSAQLEGFYGVKARAGVDVVLMGDYQVPIYAQWKYGAGMVGSFMCDLNGTWSSEFLHDANGQRFLVNAIANLMPTENIRPNEIRVDLKTENYINQMSVRAELDDGEYLEGMIVYESAEGTTTVSLNEPSEDALADCYVTLALSSDNNYTRCNFVMKSGGVYRIVIIKRDRSGNELATFETYKSFSYSTEYDIDQDSADMVTQANELLTGLAEKGNGTVVSEEEPWTVFEDFVTALDRVHDPRMEFIIIAIVLFLIDVAVRKFKFKWPHEIYREYKIRKESHEK